MAPTYSRVTTLTEDDDIMSAPFDEAELAAVGVSLVDDIFDDDDYDFLRRQLSEDNDDLEDAHLHPQRVLPLFVPPPNYTCPLTLQLMEEPVNDGCGHSYDKDAILSWLEYHEMCPISRKPLRRRDLYPARELKGRIKQWKLEHGQDVELQCLDVTNNIELMLLPQERKVLGIVKLKAAERQRMRAKHNIGYALAGIVAGVVIVVVCLALKAFE